MVKGISTTGGCSSSAYPGALAEFKFTSNSAAAALGSHSLRRFQFCLNEGNLFFFFFLSPLLLSEGEMECKGELQT